MHLLQLSSTRIPVRIHASLILWLDCWTRYSWPVYCSTEQLSSQFKHNFQKLLKTNFQDHLYEMLPVPFPVQPWAIEKEVHNYDLNRAEDALLMTSESECVFKQDCSWLLQPERAVAGLEWGVPKLQRATIWNNPRQVQFSFAYVDTVERIIRDRTLVRINCDFVEAATKGAWYAARLWFLIFQCDSWEDNSSNQPPRPWKGSHVHLQQHFL